VRREVKFMLDILAQIGVNVVSTVVGGLIVVYISKKWF